MGVTVAQAQVVAAQAYIGPLEATATAAAGAHAGVTAVLPRVASVASAAAHDAASVVSLLPRLNASGTASAHVPGAVLSRLPPPVSVVGVDQSSVVTTTGKLVLATAATGRAVQSLHATASLGALRAALQVNAANLNTVTVVASLAALRAAGTVAAMGSAHAVSRLPLAALVVTGFAQTAVAVSRLGPLQSVVHVQPLNVATVAVVATLPALRSSATSTAIGSVHGASRLPLSALLGETAAQAVHATAKLLLGSFVSLSAQHTARVTSTLGPLSTAITAQPPPVGYAADGHYYVAVAVRPFYAAIDPRSFYSAIAARSFYILSDQNMTPTFSTLDPRERWVLTFDASQDLAAGETLTAISSVQALLQFGGAGSALPTLTGPIINGSPLTLQVNGKPVTIATGRGVQVIASGGASGCQYLISVVCATSNPDKVLTLKGILPVSAN